VDTVVEIPLRRKYTTRKVVKQVSAKNGGNTASLNRQRAKHLPSMKPKTAPPPVAPPMLVMDGGTGKHRWSRG
jgi:hypothetical protein